MTTARLSPRDVQVVVSWARCGGVKGAAAELQISRTSVSSHLAHCREATGVTTNQQVLYQLFVPQGLLPRYLVRSP